MRKFDLFGGNALEPFSIATDVPPPFSFVFLDDGTIEGDTFVHTAYKASATFRRWFGVTSPFDVVAGSSTSRGVCYTEGYAVVNYGDSSVAKDDIIGPKSGSWQGWKGFAGCVVREVLDTTNKLCLVKIVNNPLNGLLCKSTAITKGNTGSAVDIWAGESGSEAITAWVNLTARAKWAAITNAKFSLLQWMQDDTPYISPLEC